MNEKYPEKNPNYSPSISYNYSPQSGYNNNAQMHPRRRNDRYRRESLSSQDRVIRQNDIIIRLLKEIRDRLPAPHYSQRAEGDAPEQGNEMQAASESWERDENAHNTIKPEKADASNQDAKNPGMSGSNEETF